MSSCLSGGGRAYRLNLDLIKPPTNFSSTSNSSSSPSSTLSESSNSPLSIFTRKPRTPRKRPNQTYNEAAAILSTAYPKLFPVKNLPKSFKLTKSNGGISEPPDLLISGKGCLLAESSASPKLVERPCRSPGEVTSSARGEESLDICDEFGEDFDAESILDEEVEEGIDSIMGNLRMEGESRRDSSNYCYGFPVGMGFDFRCGRMNELRAMRNVDGGDWWRSPSVNVVDVTQTIARIPMETETETKMKSTKKKTKAKTKSLASYSTSMASGKLKRENLASSEDSELPLPTEGLRLKLNYDDVLSAWSDKGSPFAGEAPAPGSDVQARLAQIELFPARGAIVLRHEEKRRTFLLSRKIRYKVRKANADQLPRAKGRFVRTPNSAEDD